MEDELAPEDQAAVGWAWTTRSATGQVLRHRLEQGEPARPTLDELERIRVEWRSAGRPVPQRHVHRDVVVLPDGTSVTAVSYDRDEPYARSAVPDFGLYLDPRWDPPWPHEHLEWPDFGVPRRDHAMASLERLLARARDGAVVEVGCLGGHGRTGTALACLAVLAGAAREEAVEWVRATYCDHAVETPEQHAFVGDTADTA